MTQIFLQAQTATSSNSSSGFLFMMGGMFVIMYFFIIRPQMKKVKNEREFQDSLKVGQRVRTQGGILGKVKNIYNDEIEISTGSGTIFVEKKSLTFAPEEMRKMV